MFGTLRFLLALSVALSHAGVSLAGRHIGVPAVVMFFMLSGYVVAGLLQTSFPDRSDVPLFYKERFLRLAPLYFLFMAAGILAFAMRVPSDWLGGPANFCLWLANILVVPLNYYMFFEQINSFFLIPVAWSLGLEIQFYLIAPWLLNSQRMILAALLPTFTVHALACLGEFNADWFGYRLLCGNLFMFLAGALLYRAHATVHMRHLLTALWLAMLTLVVLCGLLGRWNESFSLETGLGFLAGLPLLAWLSTLRRRKFDDWLGNIAYGVFLAHFAVMWLASEAGWLHADARPLSIYLVLVIMAAIIGHVLVERPFIHRRHLLRKKPSTG